jgi:hypothetical protein
MARQAVHTFYHGGLRRRNLYARHHGIALGREVDSPTIGDGFSSVAAVLGSSPSQDRSVNFLQSTKLVVNQVRLPSYKY